MALKPDRTELLTSIDFFMNETGNRGSVVFFSNGNLTAGGGSGSSMDDANALVKLADSPTGLPVGILLNDVVNLDLTRQHINYAKDEVQKGGKVCILQEGVIVTDVISGTPLVGNVVGSDANGNLTVGVNASTTVKIGRWLSKKDADGYAKAHINIQ